MRDEVPPPSDGIFESERRDILETLDDLHGRRGKARGEGRPLAFEKEIDREPIGLGDGRSFRLRGFIDRVDEIGQDPTGSSTTRPGSPAAYEDLVEFGRGRTLQPALYAVALEQILRGTGRARPAAGRRERLFLPVAAAARATRSWSGTSTGAGSGASSPISSPSSRKGYFFAGSGSQVRLLRLRSGLRGRRPERSGRKREANPEAFEAYDKLDEYK